MFLHAIRQAPMWSGTPNDSFHEQATRLVVPEMKPYLAIPSAMGDMFAQFEYNFEAKVWMHQF